MLLIIYLVIGLLLCTYYYGNVVSIYKRVFGVTTLEAISGLNTREVVRDVVLWLPNIRGIFHWREYLDNYEAELRNQ